MLVKDIDFETKEVKTIFNGSDTTFAMAHGFTDENVELAYNGKYYLNGYAPTISDDIIAAQVRELRNSYLQETDFTQISDAPFSDSERNLYSEYRQYLRDLPQSESFPKVEVLTFETWQESKNDVGVKDEQQ